MSLEKHRNGDCGPRCGICFAKDERAEKLGPLEVFDRDYRAEWLEYVKANQGLAAEVERLRAALAPIHEYVDVEKSYTTLGNDGGANSVRLVLRDLRDAEAEVERLQEHIKANMGGLINGLDANDWFKIAVAKEQALDASVSHEQELEVEVERLKRLREQDYIEMCDLAADRTTAEAKLARVETIRARLLDRTANATEGPLIARIKVESWLRAAVEWVAE